MIELWTLYVFIGNIRVTEYVANKIPTHLQEPYSTFDACTKAGLELRSHRPEIWFMCEPGPRVND